MNSPTRSIKSIIRALRAEGLQLVACSFHPQGTLAGIQTIPIPADFKAEAPQAIEPTSFAEVVPAPGAWFDPSVIADPVKRQEAELLAWRQAVGDFNG